MFNKLTHSVVNLHTNDYNKNTKQLFASNPFYSVNEFFETHLTEFHSRINTK